MPIKYETRDGIAVLTMQSEPANSLGLDVRRGLVESLVRAVDDNQVSAVVVTGNARFFSGGADIREFNTPRAMQEPSLRSVIAMFEDSPKPVVAAIDGFALGEEGLELALGMHYRVVAADAQVGMPEVKLGLLPGAGGTQRLPRAAGLENALNMIVSGTPVLAGTLAETRLFDQVTTGDALDAAITFAKEITARGAPWPRVRDWRVEHPNAEGFLGFSSGVITATAGPYPAPLRCLKAIGAAVLQPFDKGMRVEREAFAVLLETPESKALCHAFLAERAASKVADIDAHVSQREIHQVGIVGAGTMGGGISMNFLNAGMPVTLVETKQEALDRGLATIRGNYERSAKKGRMTAAEVEQRMALITPALAADALRDADLIIEAVFEDYTVKQAVFEQLDRVAKPGAILASNTSTLDLNRIAGFTQRGRDVVGMHFFSPANVMRLLEVVRGARTGTDVLATVLALARKIGKAAVVSGVCDGFIGNRMVEQYGRQAGFLLDEGALPQQVDHAIEAFGFAMGPFRMNDLAGNDIGWAIRKRRYVEKPDMSYSKTADLLCERGRFGQKTGAGWYDYREGDRTARPSAEIDAMVVQHSRSLGITRRQIGDKEIVERLVYALVNEGALILDEGIASKASDIDVVYLAGYGFPRWRGGPMFHADSVGLPNVLAAMRRYAAGYQGEAWHPAPLLEQLAASGATFNAPR